MEMLKSKKLHEFQNVDTRTLLVNRVCHSADLPICGKDKEEKAICKKLEIEVTYVLKTETCVYSARAACVCNVFVCFII
jgi:hypothetical protein